MKSTHNRVPNIKKNQSHRLDIYTMRTNDLNFGCNTVSSDYDHYFVQQIISQPNPIQQNTTPQTPETANNQIIQPQDFTQLWNQLQQQQREQQIIQQKVQQKEQQLSQYEQRQNVFELDEREMADWLEQCQNMLNEGTNLAIIAQNQEIVEADVEDKAQGVEDLEELWNIIEEQYERQNQGLVCQKKELETICCKAQQYPNTHKQDAIIQQSQQILESPKKQQPSSSSSKLLKISRELPKPIYADFRGYNPFYLADINQCTSNSTNSDSENLCELISSQISEQYYQIDEEVRNYNSSILVYGIDFLMYDVRNFCRAKLKEGTHMHFGLKSLGEFLDSEQNISIKNLNSNSIEKKDYLFEPVSGQCLLQTEYHQEYTTNKLSQKISFYMCSNKEKIAIAQKISLEKSQDKRQIYELKSYDAFGKKVCEYLAIIQTKISKMGDQWFCDTLIYVPVKKLYKRKISSSEWEKLKIRLKFKDGLIMAELGVEIAESSVTNCVLYNEEETCQFMMGLINKKLTCSDFVIRVGGISPVIGMLAAISRKQFANNL